MMDNDLLIQYFVNKATFLSLDFDKQNSQIIELNLGDYYTENIANDWLDEDITILNKLVNDKLVGSNAVELYSKINRNFADYSLTGKCYEENIWTIKALKEHVFGEDQRDLAKQILNELQ